VESVFTIPWKLCSPSRGIRKSAWLEGLEATFHHFGGVTREVLFDNARAIVATRAAILSGHSIYQHGMTLEPLRMNYLNQTIEFIAYEQLFAKSEDSLKTIPPMFRGAST
jgi:hypothetical protein